ncbi:polysaccharide deacetylase family protein [Muriicola sp. Z0-33]|uniref:polysaccharide deacetylase family protein n=1 Tax=Muriicola sp. Z0-33 TaxID=2816957 RepID=UPI0022384FCD|nr:polysaccharide deacetylase family protein [Muriicola sp. Z0-33]MCW5517999.1 polysaccharide deacetylase family protein [Muriicola sp. Z0-33]
MNLKSKIDVIVPKAIDNAIHLLNPLLLNLYKEEGKLLIFYFHGVYRNLEDKKLKEVSPQNNITTDQLSHFIEYFLANKYNFISPADLDAGLSREKRYIMITFDDGYFNNTWALPILRKFKVPATVFITTHNLISNESFWWDVVYKFRSKEGITLDAIRKEQQYLKAFKYSEINEYLYENFGKDCFNPWSDIDRPMTKEELITFASDEYITIGNHTHNHAILTNYSEQEIEEEFKKSNRILEETLGESITTMAFPNGNFNKNILNITEEAGFKYAFTTQSSITRLPLKNNGTIKLNRFMARTTPISNYGSFTRLGYDGNTLYARVKGKLKNLI